MPWWIKAGIAFLLAGVLIAVFLIGSTVWAFLRPPPSDRELTRRYQEHRQDFEALAALAAADSELVRAFRDPILGVQVLVRDSGGARGQTAFDAGPRRSRYRPLISRTGVRVVWRAPAGVVKFQMMSNYDVRKGLAYSVADLKPAKPSLDDLVRDVGNGYLNVAYRPLAPHWYVFLEARE